MVTQVPCVLCRLRDWFHGSAAASAPSVAQGTFWPSAFAHAAVLGVRLCTIRRQRPCPASPIPTGAAPPPTWQGSYPDPEGHQLLGWRICAAVLCNSCHLHSWPVPLHHIHKSDIFLVGWWLSVWVQSIASVGREGLSRCERGCSRRSRKLMAVKRRSSRQKCQCRASRRPGCRRGRCCAEPPPHWTSQTPSMNSCGSICASSTKKA